MAEIPAGSAVITPNEMLNEIRAVHKGVEEITKAVDRVAARIETVLPDHESRLRELEKAQGDVAKDVPDHELRIRSLEKARWLIAGFAAGGGGVVGAVVTKFLGA